MLQIPIMMLGVILGGQAAAASNLTTGNGMKIQIGNNNDVGVDNGVISNDAEIEGITIINGKLWIDGQAVRHGTTRHVSPKSGKRYRIQWGADGNIAVTGE